MNKKKIKISDETIFNDVNSKFQSNQIKSLRIYSIKPTPRKLTISLNTDVTKNETKSNFHVTILNFSQ